MRTAGPRRGILWGQLQSAVQIITWLPSYRLEFVRSDFVAGLTLAAYAIPVAIAYASLAGLPPQAGLYCYLLGGLAYVIFGTSRQAAIGPTSAMSILIGSGLGALADGGGVPIGQLAMAVAVLTGFIGIIAWLLKLGNIVNFVSETVLSGFKVGAGLVIASTQLPKLFGIHSGGSNFFNRLMELLRHIGETNPVTFAIGAIALALLVIGERLLPRRPIALIVMALSVIFISLFPLAQYGVTSVGLIPQGLPHLGWPIVRWSEIDNLLGLAMACFLLSYVESISVVRTFGLKHRYGVDADQELLALGMANLAAGLGQGYPVAGGMSQSAVNEKAGAKTPMALVVGSVSIGVVLLFFTGLMKNLPDPVLAAVVLFAVGGLVNPKELRHLYRVSRFEFRIAMVATAGVLLFGILKGVLLAAIFSLLLLLRRASRPRVVTLGYFRGTERFVDMARNPEAERLPRLLVVRVEAGLFYFNSQNVKAQILSLVQQESDLKLLVIDMSTTANIDLAGARMLAELQQRLSMEEISLALADVHGHSRDLLQLEGLDKSIPGVSERLRIRTLISESELAAKQEA